MGGLLEVVFDVFSHSTTCRRYLMEQTTLPDEVEINKGHMTLCLRNNLDIAVEMVKFRKYHLKLIGEGRPFISGDWPGVFVGWIKMRLKNIEVVKGASQEYSELKVEEVDDGKTYYPLTFKPKPEHKQLAKVLKIDIDTYYWNFRNHHVDLVSKGKGIKSEDWSEMFIRFMREVSRLERREEIDESKPADLSSLNGTFATKELAQKAIDKLVQQGVLRFDGVHYYDKGFLVAFPKYVIPQTAVVDDIDYQHLSDLDKGSLQLLREKHGDDYVKTADFRAIRARTKHRNYPRQVAEDKIFMLSMDQEPNIGTRTSKLYAYLVERKNRLYPDLFNQKTGMPVTG